MSVDTIAAARGGLAPRSNSLREAWSSRLAFVLAAAGSAVGLGNVWKFPYIAGENGGGAFVLVYLGCIVLVGLPILMAEIAIGRCGGHDPALAVERVATAEGHSPAWRSIGALGVVSAFLLLGLYSVVAGWCLGYAGYAVTGRLAAANVASGIFQQLLASPLTLIGLHTAFMALTLGIVARGVREGIERASRVMMPALLALLIALVAFAALTTGEFGRAATFLLKPDFAKLSAQGVVEALGHSFFTLSIGLGAMMSYGSYLSRPGAVGRSAIAIASLDTGVALLAGLAIFPFVFAHGLAPSAGPGLIFVSLPTAFAQMPAGMVVATAFFAFIVLAALTSSISILEPVTEYLARRAGIRRLPAALLASSGAWLLGMAAALSFSVLSDLEVSGRNVFDLMDFVISSILLPLGGFAIAVFAGFRMSARVATLELGFASRRAFAVWRILVRYVAPLGVLVVLGQALV